MKVTEINSAGKNGLSQLRGLSIDENEDDLQNFSNRDSSSEEEEEEDINKVEKIRLLMEKQMKLSQREEKFAQKIESVKNSIQEPNSQRQAFEATPNQVKTIDNNQNGEVPFQAKDSIGRSNLRTSDATNLVDPSIFQSRFSKQSQNPFALKFQEHLIKKGLLQNSNVDDFRVSERESVTSNAESEVNFDNIKTLNFFLGTKQKESIDFFKSAEPLVNEKGHFPMDNNKIPNHSNNLHNSTPPISNFHNDPLLFQSHQPVSHPWTEDPKVCTSMSIDKIMESVDVNSQGGTQPNPFDESIASDSFDYYQDGQQQTENSSEYKSQNMSSEVNMFKKRMKNSHMNSEDQSLSGIPMEYQEESMAYSDTNVLTESEREAKDNQIIDQFIAGDKFPFNDFNNFHVDLFKKSQPDESHDLGNDNESQYDDLKTEEESDQHGYDYSMKTSSNYDNVLQDS
jgi:hypothetical protein